MTEISLGARKFAVGPLTLGQQLAACGYAAYPLFEQTQLPRMG
jgi:hypothetical protein